MHTLQKKITESVSLHKTRLLQAKYKAFKHIVAELLNASSSVSYSMKISTLLLLPLNTSNFKETTPELLVQSFNVHVDPKIVYHSNNVLIRKVWTYQANYSAEGTY